jgi:broad specificity phosphatase PhoE
MKWPNTLTVIRHGQSAYNVLKEKKATDPDFLEFKEAFRDRKKDPERARELALKLVEGGKFSLKNGDHNTKLTPLGKEQARRTGSMLSKIIELPDIVFVSPYERTMRTLDYISEGWPELGEVKRVEDGRLREQEHGLATIYGDWRIFHTLHPEQALLYENEGPYWYRYPQGESVEDVRDRLKDWQYTLTREFSERRVMAVAHHLTKLGLRANLERFGAKEFLRLDREEKPINCGVTIYDGYPELGEDGRLVLREYNQQLYPEDLQVAA